MMIYLVNYQLEKIKEIKLFFEFSFISEFNDYIAVSHINDNIDIYNFQEYKLISTLKVVGAIQLMGY